MSGLSLKELAAKTNGVISQPSLSRYERGTTLPEPDKLRLLARAMGLSVDYFLRDSIELGQVEFRKKSRLGKKQQDQILEQTRDFLERYLEAEHLLNRPSAKLPLLSYTVSSPEAAEKAANGLRKKWYLGLNPIHSIVEELEARNIRVLALATDEKFDGLSSRPEGEHSFGEHSFMVFNNHVEKPIDRQRFTLLHELGHHYLPIPVGADDEKIVNRFAGAFALPGDVMKERLGSNRKRISPTELLGLKKEFGLSIAALLYRAKDLEIISSYTHQQAKIQLGYMGWRSKEPAAFVGEEQPMRLLEILARGIIEETISTGKAAQLYGMKTGDFRHVLLNGPKTQQD
jgi:Zn-dependent peptidase ImmA (M78 family)